MFIENKYKKWYDTIVKRSISRNLDGYTETHHILPKSLGGSDDAANLVILTAKEHFICHLLLTKFTSGNHKEKMSFAAKLMATAARSYQHRYSPTSRIYSMLKEKCSKARSEAMLGKTYEELYGAEKAAAMKAKKALPRGKQTPETIAKRIAKTTGRHNTAEQKERMSLAQKGRPARSYTDEEKLIISQKISAALTNKPKSEEHKKKLSEFFNGRSNGRRTEETKEKMRKPKSEEHKAKMRKPKSPEHIAAIKFAKEQKKLARLNKPNP